MKKPSKNVEIFLNTFYLVLIRTKIHYRHRKTLTQFSLLQGSNILIPIYEYVIQTENQCYSTCLVETNTYEVGPRSIVSVIFCIFIINFPQHKFEFPPHRPLLKCHPILEYYLVRNVIRPCRGGVCFIKTVLSFS